GDGFRNRDKSTHGNSQKPPQWPGLRNRDKSIHGKTTKAATGQARRPRQTSIQKGKWEARQVTEIDEQKKGRSATNGGSGGTGKKARQPRQVAHIANMKKGAASTTFHYAFASHARAGVVLKLEPVINFK